MEETGRKISQIQLLGTISHLKHIDIEEKRMGYSTTHIDLSL